MIRHASLLFRSLSDNLPAMFKAFNLNFHFQHWTSGGQIKVLGEAVQARIHFHRGQGWAIHCQQAGLNCYISELIFLIAQVFFAACSYCAASFFLLRQPKICFARCNFAALMTLPLEICFHFSGVALLFAHSVPSAFTHSVEQSNLK